MLSFPSTSLFSVREVSVSEKRETDYKSEKLIKEGVRRQRKDREERCEGIERVKKWEER